MRTILLGTIISILLTAPAYSQPPQIAASVAPLHSWVASLMKGVGEPALILEQGASPHHYAMKPSDMRKLQNADIVVWVGPQLENVLAKSIAGLDEDTLVLTLAEHRKVRGGEDESTAPEPHLWLDLSRTIKALNVIYLALRQSDTDGSLTPLYAENLAQLMSDVMHLDEQTRDKLNTAPVNRTAFIIYHDVLSYQEAAYGLNVRLHLSPRHGQKPGAQRLREARTLLQAGDASCVLADSEANPNIIDNLIKGSGAGSAMLDITGAGYEPGPNLYYWMMTRLADDIRACAAK